MASINGLLEKPQPTAMENMGFPWGKPPTAEHRRTSKKITIFQHRAQLGKSPGEDGNLPQKHQKSRDRRPKTSKFTQNGPILTIVIKLFIAGWWF